MSKQDIIILMKNVRNMHPIDFKSYACKEWIRPEYPVSHIYIFTDFDYVLQKSRMNILIKTYEIKVIKFKKWLLWNIELVLHVIPVIFYLVLLVQYFTSEKKLQTQVNTFVACTKSHRKKLRIFLITQYLHKNSTNISTSLLPY